MRLASLELDDLSLTRLIGTDRFSLRTLLATSFACLENEEILGAKGATFLKLLNVIILRYQKTKLHNKSVISDTADLYNYLIMKMSSLLDEQLLLLLLDSKNYLLREHKIATGISNEIAVHPRAILQKVVEYKASAFIIVHNHPSGMTTPSTKDINFTIELSNICEKLDIAFHDHIIVGKENVISMRSSGLFKHRNKTL
jgi:DNA repair protein RadC